MEGNGHKNKWDAWKVSREMSGTKLLIVVYRGRCYLHRI